MCKIFGRICHHNHIIYSALHTYIQTNIGASQVKLYAKM